MIKIYSTSWCSSCVSAKNLLDSLKIKYEEINIEEEEISRKDLKKISGQMTVPQIIINKKSIGGYEQLLYLYQNNKLKQLMNEE